MTLDPNKGGNLGPLDPTKGGNLALAQIFHQVAAGIDPTLCEPGNDDGQSSSTTEIIVNIQAIDKTLTRLADLIEKLLLAGQVIKITTAP